jgi:DNA polymerase III delta prime subunit
VINTKVVLIFFNTLSMSSTSSWIERYSPKKITDIVCNTRASISIQTWLTTWQKTKTMVINMQKEKLKNDSGKGKRAPKSKIKFEPSCLIVTGSHGVGKSTTVDVIVKEFGYDVQTVDFNNIKLVKNIKDSIQNIIKTDSVLDLINNHQKKVALVFDEIESITSTTDKAFIISLLKLNDIERMYPIIFISNNHHNKMLTDIKKNSVEVKFFKPYESDLKKILIRITQREKIMIKSSTVVDTIIRRSQADIRRLVYTLQDIQYTYGTTTITDELIEDYNKISNEKDIDTGLFQATSYLLNDYKSIDNSLSYYETEKTMLPLMIHQNYIENVISKYKDEDVRFKIINNVSNMLSEGDVIENYIYGDQSWDMQEVHGFYTCAATSFYLTCEKDVNIDSEDEDIERLFEDFTKEKNVDARDSILVFTSDLNKTSIKKINKKNIITTNRHFHNMNIFDYIIINKIIRKQIMNGQIKECVDTMKSYNVKTEYIESLLKIDKIDGDKFVLTPKQKKEFKKQLGET